MVVDDADAYIQTFSYVAGRGWVTVVKERCHSCGTVLSKEVERQATPAEWEAIIKPEMEKNRYVVVVTIKLGKQPL